jgi:hypothetical protein
MTPDERFASLMFEVALLRESAGAHAEYVKELASKGKYPSHAVETQRKRFQTLKGVEWLFKRPGVRAAIMAEIERFAG